MHAQIAEDERYMSFKYDPAELLKNDLKVISQFSLVCLRKVVTSGMQQVNKVELL